MRDVCSEDTRGKTRQRRTVMRLGAWKHRGQANPFLPSPPHPRCTDEFNSDLGHWRYYSTISVLSHCSHHSPNHSSRKRMQQSKKRKKSRFLDFWKNVKNVKKRKVLVTTQSVFIARQHTAADARYWYSNSVRLSVRPSVRLSVTRWYCMKTA